MAKNTLRADIYRGIQVQLLKPAILPFFFENPVQRKQIHRELIDRVNPTEIKNAPIGWFHAASVGELEMLMPVIEKWAELSAQDGGKVGSVLTIFSESAAGALKKAAERLREKGARILFSGYAPWEGEWNNALARVNPDFVMTARYEAWPELWMSLALQEIPLFIVGAKSRGSLTWARRVCGWLGQEVPRLIFCTIGEGDVAELRSGFHGADAFCAGDPRWERVMERSSQGNARARELTQKNEALARPWGVLGSAWPEDLKLWKTILKEKRWRGTLWIVPHKIDEAHVSKIEAQLRELGVHFVRSAGMTDFAAAPECVIVNEMGFLAELYSAADWAYVGGGFNEGVHNTIEPAIHGIPVACGPKRAALFPEIALLSSQGQLCVVRGSLELDPWLQKVQSPLAADERDRWKQLAQDQLGASERVLKRILLWVSGWKLLK